MGDLYFQIFGIKIGHFRGLNGPLQGQGGAHESKNGPKKGSKGGQKGVKNGPKKGSKRLKNGYFGPFSTIF